jgi:hypothetical protein
VIEIGAGSFHNPAQRLPLSRRSRHCENFLDEIIRKGKPSRLLSPAKNEGSALSDSENLKVLLSRLERQLWPQLGLFSKKRDNQHNVAISLKRAKRTSASQSPKLRERTYQDFYFVTKYFTKPGFYVQGESIRIRLGSVKEDVAALDEGPDVLESERFERLPQVLHLYELFATYIDGPEESDVSGHVMTRAY